MVNLLKKAGADKRMNEEGLPHDGIELLFNQLPVDGPGSHYRGEVLVDFSGLGPIKSLPADFGEIGHPIRNIRPPLRG